MFARYESVPTTVQAVQFTAENKNRIFNALTGQHAADFEDGKPIIKVMTVHGEGAVVRLGDWIVQDASPGTYYPVRDDVFRAKYA
jgi:hypothetical protein